MNDFQHLMVGATSDRIRKLVLGAGLSVCLCGYFEPAFAQAPPFQVNPVIAPAPLTTPPIAGTATILPQQSSIGDTSGLAQATGIAPGPMAPPLYPPVVGALPSGAGALSLGPWLLTPTLGLSTLYDSNIYSSVTNPVSGPGFNIVPNLLADYNTGIFDTQLYANINSTIYPTLTPLNDTFNWQVGAVEKYSPLRDLVFTVQGNYAHSTLAYVTTSALPTPIFSPASPLLPGAAGVIAIQQFAVNPNDTATITASVYKEFNRAFINLGTTASNTQYENSSAAQPNFQQSSYYGNGGFWFNPLLYAYASGIDAFTNPAVGPDSSSYMIRGGIGTAPIGLFTGSIYYGWQASAVVDGGTAGGDIYGGLISYAPTAVWNIALSVDELINISNLTLAPAQGIGLGGLPLVGAAVPLTESVQVTSVALRSNYTFSPQTSIFGVLSNSRIAFIDSTRVDNAWLATVGIQHRLTNNLMLNANFQYTSYVSPEPLTSFTTIFVSIGGVYSF
jgi:Putative beta-barrel porin 2